MLVGAGPNLFIETDNLFSYIHSKQVWRKRRGEEKSEMGEEL